MSGETYFEAKRPDPRPIPTLPTPIKGVNDAMEEATVLVNGSTGVTPQASHGAVVFLICEEGSRGAGSGSSGETANDDPNDDWCAVCMDGGDLVCCDNCPKVFHAGCHIPSMATIPEDSWQCMLCQSLPQLTEVGTKRNSSGAPVGTNGRVRSMSDDERRVCERILLELYCQYDNSLVFRSPVPAENAEYFKKVHNPMSLDEVRARLSRNAPDNVKYASVREFIRDVRQVFRNAFNYFDINTKEYTDGMALEEFLETQLLKYLPRFAHSDIDQELSEHDEASVQSSDDDSEIVNGPTSAKKVRRIVD
ncbi:hypothetical protein AAG570_007403 [Ranatra chinensis]|uniref:Uncharacterized protein n=1 Tax=Ranatra chinensis TaxID=642074 RepID=A0ABD0XW23_9HEMI